MTRTLTDLTICLLIAFLFRVIIPYDIVMVNPIQFNTQDAYYWLRIADQSNQTWDYFINYPVGVATTTIPFWSNMIAFFARVFGITVSQSGAILPAILGVLTIIPVYVIGRLIFNKNVAFISCLILSIMGGEFLARTQLGAADHHALEIFLLCMIMMLVILYIKVYSNAFKQTNKLDGINKILKARHIGLMALFCLLFYAMTWGGWLLAPLILLAFCFLLVLIKAPKLWHKALIIVVVFIIGVVLYILVPEVSAYAYRLSLISWDLTNTIGEEMPLLFTNKTFDMDALWGNFGVTFYLALIGLGILGYRFYKKRDSVDLLFIVWTIVIMVITFSMRRFTYYLAVNVVLLTGYFCYLTYNYIKIKTTDKKQIALLLIALTLFIGVPLIRQSIDTARSKANMMSYGWVESLRMLKSISNQDAYESGSKTEYGILSWWDYGYWIVREAHMPVLCSPGQGDRILASKILTSNDDSFIRDQLKDKGLRYIIIDSEMLKEKRYAIVQYAKASDYIMFMDRLYANQVDYCQLVFQSNEVKVFEVK